MGWEAWFTIAVVVVLVVGLARDWASPDLLLLTGLIVLMATGYVAGTDRLPSPAEAVAGLGNSGLITVGALFVVVAGLVQTQALAVITEPLIGRPKDAGRAQMRLVLPVAGLSAFLNNTPVVAMFLPVVDDICKKAGISPSKLFLPLSYAAIFGGVCTLIGTSTNLIVNGLLVSDAGLPSFSMFQIAWVGLPCAVAGMAYLLVFGQRLLPDRRAPISLSDDPREYTVEMIVQRTGPLVDKTIEEAALRHLPGLYLLEIERYGRVLPAVSPDEKLRGGDRLVFVGVLDSVLDLQRIRGLQAATDQAFRLAGSSAERTLIEAVVSDYCPVIGKNIRDGRFRTRYDAAIIAVARSGKRIGGKIGDIVLQPGDTLLLEARHDFADKHRNSRDFFLVSGIPGAAPIRREKAWLALAILAAMVTAATADWLDMLSASMVAAALMMFTRCCSIVEARQSIDWPMLLAIAAALGVGRALETSGAAGALASNLIGLAAGNPWLVLVVVYMVTMLFTEIVTNNAAAVLVFPIALAAAESLGASFTPFAVAIMIAASGGFASPIGYQTHMMVYGPGGYTFGDFLRIGVPLDLLFLAVTVVVAPIVFPF